MHSSACDAILWMRRQTSRELLPVSRRIVSGRTYVRSVAEGFGFGVGVTLTEVHPAPPPVVRQDGVVVRPGRLHELLPADALTDSELAVEIQRAEQVEAMVSAYKAERIVALAARRSASADPTPETPGATVERDERLAPEVSEFFPDELAMILNCSRTVATVQCDTSLTLVERLPATWAALADGELDWPRARAIAAELGWKAAGTRPAVIAAVETAVLPQATSLSVTGAAGRSPPRAAVPGLPGRRRPPRPGRTGRRCHRPAPARRDGRAAA